MLPFLIILFVFVAPNRVAAQGRLKVLLLGDSYTAGNGARKDGGATDNFGPKDCYRSNSNWGQKYIDQLNELGYSVTLVNRACSGSVSNDLLYDNDMEAEKTWTVTYGSLSVVSNISEDELLDAIKDNYSCEKRESGEVFYRFNIEHRSDSNVTFSCRRYIKAQLDSIDDSVDLVLMTLGGNDSKFSDIVMKCFAPVISDSKGCARQINDSKAYAVDSKNGSYQSNMKKIFTELQNKLRSDAKVVLLNYPYLAKNDDYFLSNLLGGDRYPASKNVRELGRLGDEIQDSIIPVHSADKADIYFFNEIKSTFAGHEPDMSDVFFNNKEKWLNTFNSRIPADWFHPNTKGHQAIADTLFSDLEDTVDGFPLKTHLDYDVVFIVNNAHEAQTYKKDDLAAKGIMMEKIRDKILGVANTARFGIVDYNNILGWRKLGPGARMLQDFTPDIYELAHHMPRKTVVPGHTQDGEFRHALEIALDMKWRPGVKKLIYVIGKAKSDDSTTTDGFYYNNVIEKALSLDPVAISSVQAYKDVDGEDAYAAKLAEETGGFVASRGNLDYYINSVIANKVADTTINVPYAWAGEGLSARVGETITLDGSGSFDDAGIKRYEWDINGDGVYDISSNEPTSTYQYSDPHQGLVILRVTNVNDRIALASFPATITRDGDSIDDEKDNCPYDWNEDQADADGDGAGDVCDASPGIAGYQAEMGPESNQDGEGQSVTTDGNSSTTESTGRLVASIRFDGGGSGSNLGAAKSYSKSAKSNLKGVFEDDKKQNGGSKINWFIAGGVVTGLGAAMYAFNTELFEDEEI